MCEARVVLRENGAESELMEDVSSVVPAEGGLLITNILGETMTIDARVTEIQMVHPHTVILEK